MFIVEKIDLLFAEGIVSEGLVKLGFSKDDDIRLTFTANRSRSSLLKKSYPRSK